MPTRDDKRTPDRNRPHGDDSASVRTSPDLTPSEPLDFEPTTVDPTLAEDALPSGPFPSPSTLSAPTEPEFFGPSSEESTPSDPREAGGEDTPGGAAEALLQGLKWRRPDPVVQRASSGGAPAAMHYAMHDLRSGEPTPPPMPSVLVASTTDEYARGALTSVSSRRPRNAVLSWAKFATLRRGDPLRLAGLSLALLVVVVLVARAFARPSEPTVVPGTARASSGPSPLGGFVSVPRATASPLDPVVPALPTEPVPSSSPPSVPTVLAPARLPSNEKRRPRSPPASSPSGKAMPDFPPTL